MHKAVFGTVATRDQADQVIAELHAMGFPSKDISILLPDPSITTGMPTDPKIEDRMLEGAATGGVTGAAAGGAIGLLLGLGALAIPGLGMFIAAGPIVALLAGTGIGTTVGASIGSITTLATSMNFPEGQAKHYESRVALGRILISVHTEDVKEQRRAGDALRKFGAEDVSSVVETIDPPPMVPATPAEVAARQSAG